MSGPVLAVALAWFSLMGTAVAQEAPEAGRRVEEMVEPATAEPGAPADNGVRTPDPEHAAWILQVHRQVMERFAPPTPTEDLLAIVHVELSPEGAITARRIERSSGDAAYDAAALKALDGWPQTPVPEGLVESVKQGISVRFTPPESQAAD